MVMNHRWVLGIAVLVIFCGSSLGLDFMGPPTATLNRGQIELGFATSFSENDIEAKALDVSVILDDVQVSKYYGIFNAGVLKEWEVSARIGSGDAEVDDFNGSNELAYGFGTKVTFWHFNDTWEIGGLAQISFFSADEEDTIGGDVYEIEVDDAYELQLAAGPTFSLNEYVRIYGGPMFYALEGDLDAELNGANLISVDLEETENFGGYIGAQFDICTTEISIEYLATSDAWGVGGSIVWKF